MTFEPKFDILPAAQQSLWPELQPAAHIGHVLSGGTAIALRLGHRSSIDFDFFSDRPLAKDALQFRLPFLQRGQVLQDQPNTLTVSVPVIADEPPVKLSFFGGLAFGRVGTPDLTRDGILQVASLDDLLAHKLKVVLQRAEAKDYHDIAAILEAGVPLDRGLAAARALYGHNFQPSESLKALVYFEDGDLRTLPDTQKTSLIDAARSVRTLPLLPLIHPTLALPVDIERTAAVIRDKIREIQEFKGLTYKKEELQKELVTLAKLAPPDIIASLDKNQTKILRAAMDRGISR